jgi:serralysin
VLTAGSAVETVRAFDPTLQVAMNFTGNALAQTIQGTAGSNVINGIGGADTISGLGGNDTYYVDINTDKIVEANGQGTDKLYTSVSYALAGASVETMQTTTSTATTAINLIGNAHNNTMLGNNGSDMLNGAGASDTLFGSGGKDWFRLSVAPSCTNIDTIQDFINVADDEIQLVIIAPGRPPV